MEMSLLAYRAWAWSARIEDLRVGGWMVVVEAEVVIVEVVVDSKVVGVDMDSSPFDLSSDSAD